MRRVSTLCALLFVFAQAQIASAATSIAADTAYQTSNPSEPSSLMLLGAAGLGVLALRCAKRDARWFNDR